MRAKENFFLGQRGQIIFFHAPKYQRLQRFFEFRAQLPNVFARQAVDVFCFEIFFRVEVCGLNKIHDAPQINPRIFDGRPAQANGEVIFHRLECLGYAGVGIFNFLRLVGNDDAPRFFGEGKLIRPQSFIRRQVKRGRRQIFQRQFFFAVGREFVRVKIFETVAVQRNYLAENFFAQKFFMFAPPILKQRGRRDD